MKEVKQRIIFELPVAMVINKQKFGEIVER
jgi:hypothetical protein